MKIEVSNLSYFESSSKQLSHIAYIGRTSTITKLSPDLKYWGRIEDKKFDEIYLMSETFELDS